MTYCDLEGPSVYRTTEHKARAPRKCCECNAAIDAGEKYVYIFGVWDGSPDTYSQHIACAELCEFVRDKDYADGCLPFGGFKEWWNDSGRQDYPKREPTNKELRRLYSVVLRRERR